MSETNHTNAGAEASLKPGAPKTGVHRQFEGWSILELESVPIQMPDGSYVYANVDNCPDPRDPHLYYAEITREISTGSDTRYEHVAGESFDDFIEALLYLESVDLGEYNLNEVEP